MNINYFYSGRPSHNSIEEVERICDSALSLEEAEAMVLDSDFKEEIREYFIIVEEV